MALVAYKGCFEDCSLKVKDHFVQNTTNATITSYKYSETASEQGDFDIFYTLKGWHPERMPISPSPVSLDFVESLCRKISLSEQRPILPKMGERRGTSADPKKFSIIQSNVSKNNLRTVVFMSQVYDVSLTFLLHF
jgi:hypothetical protein